MDSKDLMSLISEEISELSLLCGGMSEMESVPSAVLSLAKGKAATLLQRIELLESYQNGQPLAKSVAAPEPIKVEKTVCDERPAAPEAKPLSVSVEPELPVNVPSEPVVEKSVAAVAEEEPVKVVEKVEYQPVKNQPELEKKTSVESVKPVDDTPQEKHETVAHQETKTLSHEYGNVRTVLDANRSAKRVESRFVQSIRKAITLNDRIRYMNELFGGDAQLLSTTIDQLDAMSSLQEAKNYVKWNFSWNEEDEATADFMRLLEDRFS